MSDELESATRKKEIHYVDNYEQIGMTEGKVLFNIGHTEDIRKRNPRIINNDFSTLYEIGKGSGKFAVEIDLYDFESSKYMHDDAMLDLLLRTSYAQLATDALKAQGLKEMLQIDSEIVARYKDAHSGEIDRFLHNAKVLAKFTESVEDAQLMRQSNKRYVNNIREFAKMGLQLAQI